MMTMTAPSIERPPPTTRWIVETNSTMSSTDQVESYYNEVNSRMQAIAEEKSSSSAKQKLLAECHEWIQQLALEARSLETDVRQEWMDKVKVCKSRYQVLKQEADRAELHQGSCNDAGRQRLQDTEDRLAKQNATLEQARKTMEETEQVGSEITAELAQNRATLESTQGNIRELQGLTGRASEILKNMSKPWWRR